jgi:CHAD domain-containing protein
VKARPVKGVDAGGSVTKNAARILGVRIAELYGFDPDVRDPARVRELHDMRIAAKRLRYVLELTGHCFGEVGDETGKMARELQGRIGEIHDCDVLLPRVDQAIAELRAEDALALSRLAGELDGLAATVRLAPGRARYRGLETLAAALVARRSILHTRFIAEWSEIAGSDLRKRFEQALS